MKRILLLVALATTILTSYSQALDYNDLGLLFSKDNTNGTARFNAMSGAFGALGSDLSSTDINPAGAAVARDSKFSVTLSNRNANLDVSYYGNTNNLQDEYFNISQAGGIFVFDIDNSNSSWNRFAFTFNYKMKADFDNLYSGRGNSNFLFYDQHIGDTNSPVNIFDGSIEQSFSNETRGLNSVFNIGISAVHDNKLFVGASLKFHNLEFRERSFLTEMNDDVNGNILEVEDFRERFIEGNGFSFNLGFIYKLNKFIRLGASYESPTWYQEVIEERAGSLTMFDVNNLGITGVEDRFFEGPYSLRFTTPSRLTASGALVFGKQGLISVDYTYKDFQNFKYREVDQELQDANQFFRTDFRATQKLSVGTEWRFDRVSLRGGYSYELDPNLVVGGNTNKDNIRAFSTGLGYNFGNTKIDLSYQQSENRQFYSLYNTGDINIDNNISVIAATVTFSL
ncbi:OmpP1/FadL family transporter [Tenacibaculum sp. 190524A05c]|uniref:Long-chain fatty acid transport protein n=1 Tax=Tenacibaculum platacis TaxID=3137852 RepID=A0ABM9P218_9FLAO